MEADLDDLSFKILESLGRGRKRNQPDPLIKEHAKEYIIKR